MPVPSPKERAALDILDRLFFNQTWFISLNECPDLEEEHPRSQALIALYHLRRRVDEEVLAAKVTGVDAEALRYTVYCLLEAGFDDDLTQDTAIGMADRMRLVDARGVPLSTRAKMMNRAESANAHVFRQHFFRAIIIRLAEDMHGVSPDMALDIALKVESEFQAVPASVRYRFAERVFSMEFVHAPMQFLSWMYRSRVLTSRKFAEHWVTSDLPYEFKVRVMLQCEFTLVRRLAARVMREDAGRTAVHQLWSRLGKQLSRTARSQLLDMRNFLDGLESEALSSSDGELLREFIANSVDLKRLDDPAHLNKALEHFGRHDGRSRFWTGRQHSWAGVIGAGMIRGYHVLVDPKRKITRNGNNHSKNVTALQQGETVAQLVCEALKKEGLACRPGSLYETYRGVYMNRPAGLHHRATAYRDYLEQADIALPSLYEDTSYLSLVVAMAP